MAHIVTESLEIHISKLAKSSDVGVRILTEEQAQTIAEVVEAAIAELLDEPAIVCEVTRSS